jgi:hypothetical protein
MRVIDCVPIEESVETRQYLEPEFIYLNQSG